MAINGRLSYSGLTPKTRKSQNEYRDGASGRHVGGDSVCENICSRLGG